MRLRETSIPRGTTETCSLHRENVSGWCVTRAYAGEAIAEARTARMLVPHLREDVWNFADSSAPLRAAATNDDTALSTRSSCMLMSDFATAVTTAAAAISSFYALNIPPSRGIAIPLDSVFPCTKAAHSEYSLAPVDLWRLRRDREAGGRADGAATASRIALSDTRQPFLFPSVRDRR